MKNLFYTVVFMVMGSLGFAKTANSLTNSLDLETTQSVNLLSLVKADNNSNVENTLDFFGTCYVTLGFYDSDGNKIAERTLQIEGVNSADECSRIADSINEQLQNLE